MHATAVAVGGRALLIQGASGSGKSALALRLLAYGAGLISDDRVALRPVAGGLEAACPAPAIRGLIEARGLGILHAVPHDCALVALVVDLDHAEGERLPPKRVISLRNHKLPLVLGAQNPHLAEGLLAWMRGGRQE